MVCMVHPDGRVLLCTNNKKVLNQRVEIKQFECKQRNGYFIYLVFALYCQPIRGARLKQNNELLIWVE